MCCRIKYKSQTTLGMLQSSIRHIFPFKHVLKKKKNPKLQETEVQQGHNNKDVLGGQSYSKPAESMRSNKQPEGLGHSWPTSCLHAAAVTLPSVPGEPHHLLFLSLLPPLVFILLYLPAVTSHDSLHHTLCMSHQPQNSEPWDPRITALSNTLCFPAPLL